ncbi:Calcium-channel protein CCH1 [Wickerhamomyces ciferrii]|uniref:Calcium-channel protein CCH1 n=1 Tax=Wickerhamomyces ciferrii (strain ATCC 14091 / BCRC 22168 / CBS 111 / JCM 3599 / NBRC 0793 / NRRL Y-1031 F-60-10) TaxID=1206466 RepID=K0KJ14_WICCF|nr:Calcium-channel protein CCH1 [Wickerhamomyces ciferrii]CCH41454.1 Calcium-channel protein CCH1 [Wickerhamomyces ciferrii]
MTGLKNVPSFLISADDDDDNNNNNNQPSEVQRGRPELRLDPPSDPFSDDGASSELISVDLEDAVGSPLLQPVASKASSRSQSPLSKVSNRRRRSISSDRSAQLLNPKSSPMKRLSTSAKRLSSDESRSDRSDVSFVNGLTEEGIDDIKADLASALGTPTHEGSWLPGTKKSPTSRNSSTSKLDVSEDAIELTEIPKKTLTPEPPSKGVAFADDVSYISNTNLRPVSPTPQPHSPTSPSKTIEDVYQEFTSRIKNVTRPDIIRQTTYKTRKPPPSPTSPLGLQSSDEDDDSDYFPIQGLGVSVGTTDQLRLYGKSLKIFEPTSSIRLKLASIFLKTWPYHLMRVLLLLQTALLAYRQWNPYTMHGYVKFGTIWADWVLVGINCIYTIEIVSKIIAFGLWDDSEMFKALDKDYLPISELLRIDKIKNFILGLSDESEELEIKPALKHSVTFKNNISKDIPIQRAFLRNSWHRLDFTSTLFFWIDFFFSIQRFNALEGIPLFRALACLRILRLIDVTDRIALILRSIKNGAPQLFDMALFLLYFWVLFAIIGVQSFKSSLRRTCVWTNPSDPSETYDNDDQFCGGYLQPNTLKKMPFVNEQGAFGKGTAKGFLCPVNSKCVTGENPHGGTIGFDNILYSMEMVFVIMSANTFTDIMYDVMNTDTMAASLFYIFGIFFLFLWMINLLIAVISASFKATRDKDLKQKRQSDKNMTDFKLSWDFPKNTLSNIYLKTKWIFELVIVAGLVLQATTDSSTTKHDMYRAYIGECIVTLLLLFEIIVRFSLYLPNYKLFLKDRRNWVDLFLAVFTSIIIIPPIHTALGRGYDWLRFFQIVRFYRVVLMFKFARQLWAQVWSTMSIIVNLALFFFLLLFLSSIILSRYFEGFVPEDEIENEPFSMQNLPNTFVALYTITSTENWTDVLYRMTEFAPNKSAGAFGAMLIIGWFLLSNSIVLNIFIAIIADSLEVSENEKRKEQVRKFVLVDFPGKLKNFAEKTFLSEFKAKIFKNDKTPENQQQVMNLLLNGAAIQEFLKDELEEKNDDSQVHELPKSRIARFFTVRYHRLLQFTWIKTLIISLFWTSKAGENPFYNKNPHFLAFDGDYSLLPKNFEIETNRTIEARVKFLQENPGFNTAFYILTPDQPLRKLCQKVTPPSVGKRYDGVEPNKYLHGIFLTLIAVSTMALVIIACYSTPLYRKRYDLDNEVWNWTFDFEVAFAILFLVEFLIKVIADGLIFTPNAYFQNSWNFIDFIVLISLWINVIAIWRGDDGLSRVVRGLKALRALRLLTISDTSKNIFHKVLIVGVWKILNAAFLSFTLLLPFAIWGLNLFSGRLAVCNDGDLGRTDCYDEYTNKVFDWNIISPRVYDDPPLEFNRFASSLLTLFECLSLEGWVDLLVNIVNSTGKGTPAGFWTTPGDGAFIIAFNFLGIIFVLALFVSVIISNYSKTTGSAFMTLQQKSWTEVKKLLSQNHPRKRPEMKNLNGFRTFCFKYSVERNKYVETFLHIILWTHILAILLEMYPSPAALDGFRYTVYIISSSIYMAYISMKLIAMGFKTFFKVKWNVYQLFVFLGAFSTSLASFFVSRSSTFANINKLFLVGIFTVLIPSSNRLSHLLKIGSASIPSLLSLIFTWGILFLVFAIALNQIFGLTKLGANTSVNLNLRTVTKSLLLLFRASFGEGWNYTMRDFAIEQPYCSEGLGFSTTDCGSQEYAYILFIIWNILSMYIFVNMFISLIFENFSYVYSDNGSKITLNREEIRKFKTVWQRFDPHGTGYIRPEQLPILLRSMEGYFSFKIYEGKWTIPELKKKWFELPEDGADPYDVFVNFAEINKTLNQLDVQKVRERTRAYEKFIEEALLTMEINEEPGISFSRIILQIPLYSRFEESNCLTLSDFMDRLLVSKKVEKRLENRKHLAVLEMITYRWKFKHRHDAARNRYNSSMFSSSSSGLIDNPFERHSLMTRTSSNPFKTPAIVVTENDNESLKAVYKSQPEKSNLPEETLNYRTDVTPKKKRAITGSLDIPDDVIATPAITPDANQFTTDNSYWSPPKQQNLEVMNDETLYDNISDLSDSLSRSDWGDVMREVHSEQQSSLDQDLYKRRKKEEEKKEGEEKSNFDFEYENVADDEDEEDEGYTTNLPEKPKGSPNRRIL